VRYETSYLDTVSGNASRKEKFTSSDAKGSSYIFHIVVKNHRVGDGRLQT